MAYRTDRNFNPIAAAMYGDKPNGHTAALDKAGIKWEVGDPFPSGNMRTIRILGDGWEGARAILMYSKSIQNWYVNHTGAVVLRKYKVWNDKDFRQQTKEVQDDIIKGIYMKEGGDGSLLPRVQIFGGFPTASAYLSSLLKAIQRPSSLLRMEMMKRAIERLKKMVTP